jgi:DNA-binding MurR/RpiR family transcriptional regulator
MFTEQKTRGGVPTGYGLGWGIGSHEGHLVISHTGEQDRVSAILHLHPETGVIVVLLTNLEETKTEAAAEFIAEAVESGFHRNLGR